MKFKNHIRSLMETKIDDYVIQGLIILSLILLVIETEPWLSQEQLYWLHMLDKVIVIIFTVEYLIRWWLDGKKFIFSFHGLIDLLAILPYYISLGVGYQSIRVFRLFRLLRILKLARYTNALDKIIKALVCVKSELIVFTAMAMSFIYASAVVIYHIESAAQPESIICIRDALWWAVVTFTTIGYGDVYPVTTIGKILTMFLAIAGVGIVAIPTGLISSSLGKMGMEEMMSTEFNDRILIPVESDGSCDGCVYVDIDECPKDKCENGKMIFTELVLKIKI